ncbi:antitoxin of toxin-antitoxin stability system [Photorhabdus caribbeanensis]|uniref:antitoxin of toxin-antitoxin stability system n=1 Tax=Photorhabdus caribbeanensis TaxID=1004165 RepID=UPI001BD6972D|nr:antitoxin of toxin-antitoxin stability system [Photorhabdus caribbeanensis]MBS9423078.1 antitoxin of toxin-antitoxin stability system [Photorhabdus caribbeanensis]
MTKQAVFTMKLEPELRAKFIQRQREEREYNKFLCHKVEAGRASMRAGLGQSNDEVEAEFAARRANVG